MARENHPRPSRGLPPVLGGLAADDREQLGALASAVTDVLGPSLQGLYLYGSATTSGLRPRSDLDLFAVVAEPLDARAEPLVSSLMALSGGASRPVELTVVVGPQVRPWRYPPLLELQYGEWLRTEFEAGSPCPWGGPESVDLTVALTQVLNDGVALLGPAAADLLPEVPADDLRRAVLACVPDLLTELDSDTRNVLLTLARIAVTASSGDICSKDAAADNVLPLLPPQLRPVLVLARDDYLMDSRPDWAALSEKVGLLAEHLVRLIRSTEGRTG